MTYYTEVHPRLKGVSRTLPPTPRL